MSEETTNGVFVKVEASKLSLEDEFMRYQLQTKKERVLKQQIETAIRNGLKDFWRPRYDPAFNDAGTGICYMPGRKPAEGKCYNWWAQTAKKYAPERGSRLGTKTEYIAFMAVLIKELVASGKSVEWAWNAVCNDSKELGHYWDSENAKHAFEETGSREISGFYDLGNTYKILAEDPQAGGFWIASGDYGSCGLGNPLADLNLYAFRFYGLGCYGCGWLVLS